MNTTRRDSLTLKLPLPQQTEEEKVSSPIYRRPKDDPSPVKPCVKRQPVKPRRAVFQFPGERSVPKRSSLSDDIERKHSLIVHGFIRQHCRDCPRDVSPDVVAIISELTDKCDSAVIHMVDLCLRPANNGQFLMLLNRLNKIYRGECRVHSLHMVRQAFRLFWCINTCSQPSRKPRDLVMEIVQRVVDTYDTELVLSLILNSQRGNFLRELVRGLRSLDKQGRDGATKIIFSVYGRFQQTRAKIRTLVSTQCLQYIHCQGAELEEEAYQNTFRPWQGVPEYLSLLQGFIAGLCDTAEDKLYFQRVLNDTQEEVIAQLCECTKSVRVHPKVALLAIHTLVQMQLKSSLFQEHAEARSKVSSALKEAAATHRNHAVRGVAAKARETMDALTKSWQWVEPAEPEKKENVDEDDDDDDDDDTDDEDYGNYSSAPLFDFGCLLIVQRFNEYLLSEAKHAHLRNDDNKK